MYYFILLIFIIITCSLVTLIMLHPVKKNDFYSSYKSVKLFNPIYYNTIINRIIKFLIVIFLLLSVLICNLNMNNIIMN
ncbi:preprotein translocase subunit SecG [Buchnera aphidicola]|uniref:Protein-export membrane protein SecG n=1 Tax=Buchnera aphidicola (Stegophylla sp.) TaxID=2315800 RepID=A0A4D6YKB4_9GAMM|nr:preprotein translocase subunit SecG [Buchnera aphidicola (Stegophylla sp.)]QCI26404.1 preprotein translocase subunit SecG [Buchnera aphidicola (Stegophylla sp.)]